MAKFPINHIALVYSGDNCYHNCCINSHFTIQLLTTKMGLGHVRCLVPNGLDQCHVEQVRLSLIGGKCSCPRRIQSQQGLLVLERLTDFRKRKDLQTSESEEREEGTQAMPEVSVIFGDWVVPE